jgi:hypothetical protein
MKRFDRGTPVRASLLVVALLAFSAARGEAATIVAYNTFAAWQAALNANSLTVLDIETFEASGLQSFTDADVNFGNPGIGPARVNLSGSVWQNAPAQAGFDMSYIGTGSLFAFGATFDTSGPGGVGTGIDLVAALFGGGTQNLGNFAPGVGFLGFVSDTALTGFISSTVSENYDMDNLYWAGQAPAPVPEPATVTLLLTGLGAAAMRRRRARTTRA